MSFLNFPRLVFSGQFQADPSTVNNDPRHYSNASFEDRFQNFQVSQDAQTTNNGWWNPIGTSIFRFVPSSVVSLWTKGGKQIFDPSADNAFTLKVGNSPDRSYASHWRAPVTFRTRGRHSPSVRRKSPPRSRLTAISQSPLLLSSNAR